MNQGEVSGAPQTPNIGGGQDPMSPNINKKIEEEPQKMDIAAAMAAELAAAEKADSAEPASAPQTKEAPSTPSFVVENKAPVETIVASGEDYANAFSLAYTNEVKSVKVGSATAQADAAKREAVGLTGRSRYGLAKKHKTKAEKEAEKAAAKRAAEEKAKAEAAAREAEKARQEQLKQAQAKADAIAKSKADAERKAQAAEAAEAAKAAKAAEAARAAADAKAAEEAKAAAEAKTATVVQPQPLPDFFAKAANEDVVVIKGEREPRPRSWYLRIAVIVVLVVAILGGLWALGNSFSGNHSGGKNKQIGNSTGGKTPISAEEIGEILSSDGFRSAQYLEEYVLKLARNKQEFSTNFVSRSTSDIFTEGLTQYEAYYNKLADSDLRIYYKYSGNNWPETMELMRTQRSKFQELSDARNVLLKALQGDGEAKNEIDSGSENAQKLLKLYQEAQAELPNPEDQLDRCYYEDGDCDWLYNRIKEVYRTQDIADALSDFIKEYVDVETFDNGKSAITRSKSALTEVKNEKEAKF